jgi:hypothetical protein
VPERESENVGAGPATNRVENWLIPAATVSEVPFSERVAGEVANTVAYIWSALGGTAPLGEFGT